jgi:hypothetical protein
MYPWLWDGRPGSVWWRADQQVERAQPRVFHVSTQLHEAFMRLMWAGRWVVLARQNYPEGLARE